MKASLLTAGVLCAELTLAPVGHAGAPQKADTPVPATGNAKAPSEREAGRFARAITSALAGRDMEAFGKLLRMQGAIERIAGDLGLPAAARDAFFKGAAKTMVHNSFGTALAEATRNGGSYKLLRTHTVAGRPRVLFRMLTAEGMVNYHDYFLVRFPDGAVGAEDVFVLMTAEPLSETLRRLTILALKPGQGPGKAAGFDLKQVADLQRVTAMTRAIRSKEPARAVAEYRKLAKTWQEQKAVLLLYMQAIIQLGPDADPDYLATVELYRKLYPDDASVDFVSIDYYFLKKQYTAAGKAIDQVNRSVGGDPYLDVLRGNCWMEAGRLDEARRAMEKAITAEPDLVVAYWCRIALSLREKKHADTLAWLKKIVEQCREKIGDLTTIPEYADFVRSSEYRTWEEWYGDRNKRRDND